MHDRIHIGLKGRLLLVLILAMSPGIINSCVDVYRSMQETRSDARDRLISTLVQVRINFEDRIVHILGEFDRSEVLLGVGTGSCAALSNSLRDLSPEFIDAGVIDVQGHLMCTMAGPGSRPDPAWIDQDMIQDALSSQGQPLIKLVPALGKLPPRLVIMKASVADRGQPQHVVYETTEIGSVLESARKLTPRNTRFAFIQNRGATLRGLTQLDNDLLGELGKGAIPLLQGVRGSAGPSAHIVGRNLLVALPLGKDGVNDSVVLSVNTGELYRNAWLAFGRSIGILLTGLIILILLLRWITDRWIIRPSRILTDTANRLASGDLDARTGLAAGSDEFSRVAFAFDQMAADMQKRIQENQRHTRSIERLNQLHEALSAITAAIHRRTGTTDLNRDICEIFCRTRHFTHVWIGAMDVQTKRVRVVAWDGAPNDVLDNLSIDLDSTLPEGRGYVAEAIHTGQPRWTNDFQSDPKTRPWHAFARKMRVHSTLVVPMVAISQEQARILVLHSSERDYFAAEEIRLIELIAQDAAIGLKLTDIEKEFAHSSSHDVLTGLPNEQLLMPRMQTMLDRATRLGGLLLVAVLDLDIQSATNKLGLRQGNELLRQLAQNLESGLDMPDAVGVVGLGRFALVMDNFGTIDAAANRLRDMVARLHALSTASTQGYVHLGIRVGVAVFPKDAGHCEELLDIALATLDMIDADHGEPVRFFTAETNRVLNENRELQKDLHNAIKNDELTLLYQPIVSLKSGAPGGFEALLRWQHPTKGPISPTRFIPLAEGSNLISEIGLWVIEQVAQQAVAWERLGAKGLFISLNVSPLQLNDSNFVTQVRQLLAKPDMRSEHVRLGMEVTEGHLIEDIRSSVDVLKELRGMGIIVILDDFGTGYSSLSYLHHLPVDIVKIDKSFIRNIGTSQLDQKLVQGIHALAQSLDMQTVAEGIEQDGQRRIMQDMGCSYGQGFLFGPALSAEVVESDWLGHAR